MLDSYFLEIDNLRFDLPPTGEMPDDIRDALDGWVPRGKGVFARLENRWMGRDHFDYVLITDDLVYFAILSHELQPRLLSMKCFKSAEMVGFAFLLENVPGASDERVPQIRLMMDDGKRLKLVLDPSMAADAQRHMKDLATKNFFIC